MLADPIRVRFLLALGEDRTLPAGELARLAHVSPSAASFHLGRLTDGGLLQVEAMGKHRYYRLSSRQLAGAVEALALVCPVQPVTSLRQSRAAAAVRYARICDGHLAGHLGVALTDALVEQNTLSEADDGYAVTGSGRSRLAELGVPVSGNSGYPGTATRHPDWSQGGHHLAGPLATALTNHLLDHRWIVPARASRAVHLTPEGHRALHKHFPKIKLTQ
jgi:DNA-binding transcriptional ArsR family regulator